MPNNPVTTAILPEGTKTFYDRALLKRLKANLVFYKFGVKKAMPKNSGDTLSKRYFNPIAPSTTPLVEGVTPNANSNNMTEVKYELEQYGDFIEYTDKLDLTGIDPYVTETTDSLGEQAAESIDTVLRDKISIGTSVHYAGGKTSTASITKNDLISSKEIMKVVRTLKENKVKPHTGKDYIGIIDPSIEYDIMQDPLWQDVSKYNGGTKIMDGEIGKLGSVRFVTTTQVKIKEGAGADGIDVHCCLIFGKDAYIVSDIDNTAKKPEIIVKPLGSAGTEDPLDQRGSIGWKAFFTGGILNQLSIVRLECAVSE